MVTPKLAFQPDGTGHSEQAIAPFIRHIREVNAGGDPEFQDVVFTYIIHWLAYLVQFPRKKPGVALVNVGSRAAERVLFSHS